jgi:uncharacterized protein YbjT (DUF2867 family)
MKIVVIGGTGLIGSKLVNQLHEQEHEAVAAAPNTGVNTLTCEGLAEVLKGASVVVDVSNSPAWEDAAVLNFFETSTRNLLTYEAEAGVGHHVALSVVGTERLLPGQDGSGEVDQGIFNPLLHRACDAVLRVRQGPCGYFHGWRQGAFASCAFPADGGRRCRECRRQDRGRSAGKWHS